MVLSLTIVPPGPTRWLPSVSVLVELGIVGLQTNPRYLAAITRILQQIVTATADVAIAATMTVTNNNTTTRTRCLHMETAAVGTTCLLFTPRSVACSSSHQISTSSFCLHIRSISSHDRSLPSKIRFDPSMTMSTASATCTPVR